MMKTYNEYIVDYDKYGGFDVVLVCDHQSFLTHRIILSAGSKYLASLLKDCELEEETLTILLVDFQPGQVKQMVDILYNQAKPSLTSDKELEGMSQLSHSLVPPIFSHLRFSHVTRDGLKETFEPDSLLSNYLKDGLELPLEIKSEELVDHQEQLNQQFDDEDDAMEEEQEEFINHSSGEQDLPKKREIEPDKIRQRVKKKRKVRQDLLHLPTLTCPECDFTTKSKSRHGIHLRAHAREKKVKQDSWPCDQCDYVGLKKCYLSMHIKRNHTEGPYTCEHCEKVLKSKQYLVTHIRMYHKGESLMCEKCPFTSKYPEGLSNHVKKEHEGMRFICDKCGFEATSPKTLHRHIQAVHEGVRYKCTECDLSFPRASMLSYHRMKIHSTDRFMCEKCSFESSVLSELRRHIKTVHAEPIHQCSMCDFKTKVPFSLKRHKINKHKEEMKTILNGGSGGMLNM